MWCQVLRPDTGKLRSGRKTPPHNLGQHSVTRPDCESIFHKVNCSTAPLPRRSYSDIQRSRSRLRFRRNRRLAPLPFAEEPTENSTEPVKHRTPGNEVPTSLRGGTIRHSGESYSTDKPEEPDANTALPNGQVTWSGGSGFETTASLMISSRLAPHFGQTVSYLPTDVLHSEHSYSTVSSLMRTSPLGYGGGTRNNQTIARIVEDENDVIR